MQNLSFVDQLMHKVGTAAGMPVYMQGAMIYDPAKTDNEITAKMLAEHIAARLANFSILQKKLVQDSFRIGTMKLVDDPGFNPLNHIGFRVLPSPGDQDTLSRAIGEFSAEGLDYSRPPWRIEIIEGLENGRMALVQKLSHATMDGTVAMKIFQSIFDPEPMPLDQLEKNSWEMELEPSSKELLSGAVKEQLHRLGVQTPKGIYAASKMAAKYAGNVLSKKFLSASDLDSEIDNEESGSTGDSLSAATKVKPKIPKTSFNCSVSKDKRVIAFQNYELDKLKALSKSLGCTLNDLCLVMISQALNNYFKGIKEKVDGDLVVCMPLNMRKEGDDSHGNMLGLSMINIRSTIDDLHERLLLIQETTSAAKDERKNKIEGSKNNYGSLIDMVSPFVIDLALGALHKLNTWSKLPSFMNVVVSNVAGPREGMYFAGMPIDISIPMIPFFHTGALAIGATSMGNTFSFGFHACGKAVKQRNLHFFIEGLDSAYDELSTFAANRQPALTADKAPEGKQTEAKKVKNSSLKAAVSKKAIPKKVLTESPKSAVKKAEKKSKVPAKKRTAAKKKSTQLVAGKSESGIIDAKTRRLHKMRKLRQFNNDNSSSGVKSTLNNLVATVDQD